MVPIQEKAQATIEEAIPALERVTMFLLGKMGGVPGWVWFAAIFILLAIWLWRKKR